MLTSLLSTSRSSSTTSPRRFLNQSFLSQLRLLSSSSAAITQPSHSNSIPLTPTTTLAHTRSFLKQTSTKTGLTSSIPLNYLKSMDDKNYNLNTQQRVDVPIDSISGVKVLPEKNDNDEVVPPPPTVHDINVDDVNSNVVIEWNDGASSTYTLKAISDLFADSSPHYSTHSSPNARGYPGKIAWGKPSVNFTLQSHACMKFSDIVNSDPDVQKRGMTEALTKIYTYGILLVTETPVDKQDLAAFAAALCGGSCKKYNTSSILPAYHATKSGLDSDSMNSNFESNYNSVSDGPMDNLYGRVWSTSSSMMGFGTSVSDSAYTSEALPLHTDMTYYTQPPGLQIFSMQQPAREGGESVFGDGLRMAEALRLSDPDAFHMMCSVRHRFRCVDDGTGWHLEASGTVIECKPGNGIPNDPHEVHGEVVKIRHNDLDRMTVLPDKAMLTRCDDDEIDAFYATVAHALRKWDEQVCSAENRYVVPLKKGEMVAVSNQRVMHGRQGFVVDGQSQRVVGGTYVGQDEMDSRFRRIFDYGE